ncbi:MAG: SDR family oxidoreductase [Chitinophagales bacterium]|jgi:3-dehydrosphinganine reductase|nr:SDR family oxidoreductase [Chitinophagales bacterium]
MSFYQHKTAFITGGSTGIGLAIAKSLAAQGSHVIIFARTVSKLENALESIKQSQKNTAQKINSYSVDTSDNIDVKTVFEKAIVEMGTPDILINCVGIAQPDYFENITFEIFDKTIKTNLYSTWNSVYTLVPYMKEKGGIIVNTSSIAGFLGVFGYADYCMTKFGIIGFSEALRSELKQHNIKVQVLCPPDTDTPGFEAENKNKPAETIAIGGKAKLLKPEFVAAIVLKEMQKKSFLIIPGLDGKMTRIIKRFFPWLIDWIMNSSIQKAQKK